MIIVEERLSPVEIVRRALGLYQAHATVLLGICVAAYVAEHALGLLWGPLGFVGSFVVDGVVDLTITLLAIAWFLDTDLPAETALRASAGEVAALMSAMLPIWILTLAVSGGVLLAAGPAITAFFHRFDGITQLLLLMWGVVGLFVVFGCIASIINMLFMFVPQAVLVEGNRWTAALDRSVRLLWSNLGTVLVVQLLLLVVFAVVPPLVFPIGKLLGGKVAVAIVGIVTQPLHALTVVLLYLDSRAQNDDLDRQDLRRTIEVLTAPAV